MHTNTTIKTPPPGKTDAMGPRRPWRHVRLSPQSHARLKTVSDALDVSITVLVEKALRGVVDEMSAWSKAEVEEVRKQLDEQCGLDRQNHNNNKSRRMQ